MIVKLFEQSFVASQTLSDSMFTFECPHGVSITLPAIVGIDTRGICLLANIVLLTLIIIVSVYLKLVSVAFRELSARLSRSLK